MLIGGDDCSNDIITRGTCFSMFVYICARFRFSLIGGNLTGQWTGSRRGIGGEIQMPETQLQARRLRNPQHEIQNSRLSGVQAVITYYSDLLYPGYQRLFMLGFEFRSLW